ncbi:hypothetical protein [Streptomyces sp. NPDC049887]|uniref:hypothetical protein n=1 Tax=unclassified Streptomyces TaxID=2593676 RepID=UPI0034472CEE
MSLSRMVLRSGRPIELSEVRLSSTYGGMPEGHPCKPVNDLKVSGLLRTAERAFPTTPVHLVQPSREYPDRTAGAFGPVEVLPSVACIGAFRSTAVDPDRDPVLYRSPRRGVADGYRSGVPYTHVPATAGRPGRSLRTAGAGSSTSGKGRSDRGMA